MQKKNLATLVASIVVLGCLAVPTAALAMSGASGQADFTYGPGASSTSGPASAQNGTGMEAESKLFYTEDGSWWGVLGTDNPTPGVFLYHLVNDQWEQVLQLPGSDPWMKADVVYDAATSKLYVSLRDSRSLTGNPRISQLYVFTHESDGTWTLNSGPTLITKVNARNLTIALDSQGRLWTTYETGGHIKVGFTQPGGTSFSFSNIPWTSVTSKDTSAVVSFGTVATGFKIGVMWDDTNTKQYVFAWRNDSDPTGSPWTIETAYGNGVGGCPTATTSACANYHISIRSNGDDVYAALKLMSQDSTNPNDPMIVLAHRDPLGLWSASTVSIKRTNASRQILLLAPAQDRVYVIAESPKSGLFVWESSLLAPAFDPLQYSQWAIPNQNLHEDPTSTKQSLGVDGSAVVESSQGSINQYWRNEFSAF
ncbi:MAG: trimeric autotransporter adhesin [Actinomycetota bacterium]|nr:trimeric autotransporter adhesin [Actinomycetota bacterium]